MFDETETLAALPLTVADDVLACPNCGESGGVHIDEVSMVGRPWGEDGPTSYAEMHANGNVYSTEGPARSGTEIDLLMKSGSAPAGKLGNGRRHRTVLEVRCEQCDVVTAIVFTQHKGQTLVEAIRPRQRNEDRARPLG